MDARGWPATWYESESRGKMKTRNARCIIRPVIAIPCVCLSPDPIEGTSEIMMLTPIALRELCITLDLSSPAMDRKFGFTGVQ